MSIGSLAAAMGLSGTNTADEAISLAFKFDTIAAGETVSVESCFTDSPCAAAGIRPGDRITRIDEATISSLAELRLALWHRQPGETIRIGILRPRVLLKDKAMTHEITLQ